MAQEEQDLTASGLDGAIPISPTLAALATIAQGLAATLGDRCEVVIHDLSDWSNLDHTILTIAGDITGRQVGGPPTDIVLRKLRAQDQLPDVMIYTSTTRDGRVLKSSTTFIRNERGKVVAAFCINLDITQLLAAKAALDSFCLVGQENVRLDSPEVFGSVVAETLDGMLDDAIRASGKLIPHMDKEDKVGVVRYLERRGGFLIRGAVDQVARRLAVSRYTVYNYLNEVRADPL